MKTLIKSTALTLALLSTAGMNANALSTQSPINGMTTVVQEASITPLPSLKVEGPVFNTNAKIGIARLDKGRLIAAPFNELRDWAFLDKRAAANFGIISPAAVLKNIPNVPMDGRDSDNKLDEIRLTASDLGMDYILIYGMGKDAEWGSFAGKAMVNTGLTFASDNISPRGDAKAILVDTYTGKVFGTVTSDEVEFGVGDLTDKVQSLIEGLSTQTAKA